jgi:hypothetical protein
MVGQTVTVVNPKVTPSSNEVIIYDDGTTPASHVKKVLGKSCQKHVIVAENDRCYVASGKSNRITELVKISDLPEYIDKCKGYTAEEKQAILDQYRLQPGAAVAAAAAAAVEADVEPDGVDLYAWILPKCADIDFVREVYRKRARDSSD